MNRYLKREIKKALEAPLPDQQEKERFLRTLPISRTGMGKFLLTQITYLRKRTLVLSILFLLPALMRARCVNQDTLWVISALIPFLALLAVTENSRSARYGMQELEMSTRFSVKSVMLARMSAMGFLDALILCCLIPLCSMGSRLSLLQTGLCLLVPYLLTVNVSLCLTRCLPGREASYGCMCAAVLVSGGSAILPITAEFIYRISYIHWWILLALFLTGKAAQEIGRTIKQTEELAWNL